MKCFGSRLALVLSGALSLAGSVAAHAEISDNVVRVGVLNDISGIFQDTNGMGSVEAARMASRRCSRQRRRVAISSAVGSPSGPFSCGRIRRDLR